MSDFDLPIHAAPRPAAKLYKDLGDGRFGEVVSTVSRFRPVDVHIDAGQSLSEAVDLGEGTIVRINMPAAWTAAGLTISVSEDGVEWTDLWRTNNGYGMSAQEVLVDVAASRSVIVYDFWSVRFIKLRSGPSTAPVPQAADRTITLVVAD